MKTLVQTRRAAVQSGGSGSMRGAVIQKANQLVLQDVAMPVLQPGETLVKVDYCGICGSDIHVLHGAHPTARFPVVPGHEFVGEFVAACGAGAEDFTRGEKVLAQPVISCGNCEPCAKGRDNVCKSLRFVGIHTNGGFAQYVKVLTRKVYRMPKGLDTRLACLAEPVAVAVHDVRSSELKVGESALVIGGGPIGLLIAIVARSAGASKVLVSEINPYRCQAAQDLGFETVNPLEADAREQMLQHSGGLGFDVVFEVSGSKPGVATSTDMAKITGRVMVVGMTSEPCPVDLAAVFAKELTLRGVRIHSQYNFIGAIDLLADPALQPQFRKLITHVLPLEQVTDAFELAQSKENFLKILVEM